MSGCFGRKSKISKCKNPKSSAPKPVKVVVDAGIEASESSFSYAEVVRAPVDTKVAAEVSAEVSAVSAEVSAVSAEVPAEVVETTEQYDLNDPTPPHEAIARLYDRLPIDHPLREVAGRLLDDLTVFDRAVHNWLSSPGLVPGMIDVVLGSLRVLQETLKDFQVSFNEMISDAASKASYESDYNAANKIICKAIYGAASGAASVLPTHTIGSAFIPLP